MEKNLMRWPIQFVVLVLTALSFVTLASAQSITSGVVTGTVTDPTGSSIPNASHHVGELKHKCERKKQILERTERIVLHLSRRETIR